MQDEMKMTQRASFILLILFLSLQSVTAAESARLPTNTPLESANLDPAAFTQWFDGSERPMAVKNGPRQVMWTRDTGPEWDGVHFGESNLPGPRHLRVGFKDPVEIGAILVRAGGRVSALKEAQPIPAT